MLFSWKKKTHADTESEELSGKAFISWLLVPIFLKVIFSVFTAKKSYWFFIQTILTLFWYKEQLAEITYQ